jgi:hypothetical protein
MNNTKKWHLVTKQKNVEFADIVDNKYDAYILIKKQSDSTDYEKYNTDDFFCYNCNVPQIRYRTIVMRSFWQIIKNNDNIFYWDPKKNDWVQDKNRIDKTFFGEDKDPANNDNRVIRDKCFEEMKKEFGEYLKSTTWSDSTSAGGKKSKKTKKYIKKQRKTRRHKK